MAKAKKPTKFKLPVEDREDMLGHLRDAIYHLTSCWDALRQAEGLVPGEINEEDISGYAGNTTDPADAYKQFTEADMDELLESLDFEEDPDA